MKSPAAATIAAIRSFTSSGNVARAEKTERSRKSRGA
jgi:hypothetical protein